VPGIAFGQSEPCPPMLMDSTGGSSSFGCGRAPSWFTNLGHLEWAAPVANWLGAEGVKQPGSFGRHAAIIDDWNGMLADQTRRMIAMCANGGHNGWYGNEVYSCDLTAESPVWVRRRDASPNATPISGSWIKWDFDGGDHRIAPPHTNNAQVSANGRWFILGMSGTCYLGGSPQNYCWEYDPTRNDWIDLGRVGGPNGGNFGTTAMYWPDGGDGGWLIRASNDSLVVTTLNDPTNVIVQQGGSGNNVLMADVDTVNRNLLLYDQQAGSFYWYDLDGDLSKSGRVTIAADSVPGPTPLDRRWAIHYHAPSQAFLTWSGNGHDLLKLTPTVDGGGNYIGLEWSAVAGTGVQPVLGDSKMYNKIQLIRDMGNGDSALVVVPRYGNPDVYVCRIAGGV
jgi:hypothetical protein